MEKHSVIWESHGIEDSLEYSARIVNFEDLYFLEMYTPPSDTLWERIKVCWKYLWKRCNVVNATIALSWDNLIDLKVKLDKTIGKKSLFNPKRNLI